MIGWVLALFGLGCLALARRREAGRSRRTWRRFEAASRSARGLAPPLDWARRPLQEPALSQLRREIAEGATHDCGEWRHQGRCQLCDRVVWS